MQLQFFFLLHHFFMSLHEVIITLLAHETLSSSLFILILCPIYKSYIGCFCKNLEATAWHCIFSYIFVFHILSKDGGGYDYFLITDEKIEDHHFHSAIKTRKKENLCYQNASQTSEHPTSSEACYTKFGGCKKWFTHHH